MISENLKILYIHAIQTLILNNICSNLVSSGKLVKGGGHNYSSGCTSIGSYHDILELIANEILNS